MKTHQTVSGHVIEYTPTPDVAKYLAKIQAMSAKASEAELIAAIYSPDNPVMDANIVPGRGMVTPAVLANPVYQVMTDMLARKSMEVRGVKAADLAKNFTMTAVAAAQHLGVSRAAIYKAVETGRLSAWMIDGQQMIDPRSLAAYDFKPRGPLPAGDRVRPSTDPLQVRVGSDGEGATMHVLAPFEYQPAVERSDRMKHAQDLEVNNWRRVGVFTGSKDGKARFMVLEPSDKLNKIEFGGLYVRGKFGIVEKVNNARRAREAMNAFEPA